MSRPVDNLPPTARAIALLLSSTPSVQDAQPAVLHQLLEFSNRYTQHVLTDARVYAEHANRGSEKDKDNNKVEMEDVVLAVQARVGWEFGGRVPKEYILTLATQTNAIPLPAVPEVFGVRLPPSSDCLTAVDFDLIPNKPPPGVKIYDEEIVEEIEDMSSDEEDDGEDEDMEPAEPYPQAGGPSNGPGSAQFGQTNQGGQGQPYQPPPQDYPVHEEAPFPISAIADPSDMPMHTGSDDEEEDGLFAGRDDDDEDSDAMEEVQTTLAEDGTGAGTGEGGTNGVKRKLQEDDDYD